MYAQLFEIHALLLKALAHPRRLEIVHLLRDRELPVTDIHTMLDLPQANISQHLMILRDEGIVTARKDGKQIYYQVSDPRILAACDLLREILIDRYKNTALARALEMEMTDLVPVVQDPVCRMRVSPRTAGFHTYYDKRHYYFCASGCLKKFTERPERYANKD